MLGVMVSRFHGPDSPSGKWYAPSQVAHGIPMGWAAWHLLHHIAYLLYPFWFGLGRSLPHSWHLLAGGIVVFYGDAYRRTECWG